MCWPVVGRGGLWRIVMVLGQSLAKSWWVVAGHAKLQCVERTRPSGLQCVVEGRSRSWRVVADSGLPERTRVYLVLVTLLLLLGFW